MTKGAENYGRPSWDNARVNRRTTLKVAGIGLMGLFGLKGTPKTVDAQAPSDSLSPKDTLVAQTHSVNGIRYLEAAGYDTPAQATQDEEAHSTYLNRIQASADKTGIQPLIDAVARLAQIDNDVLLGDHSAVAFQMIPANMWQKAGVPAIPDGTFPGAIIDLTTNSGIPGVIMHQLHGRIYNLSDPLYSPETSAYPLYATSTTGFLLDAYKAREDELTAQDIDAFVKKFIGQSKGGDPDPVLKTQIWAEAFGKSVKLYLDTVGQTGLTQAEYFDTLASEQQRVEQLPQADQDFEWRKVVNAQVLNNIVKDLSTLR